MKIKFCKDCKYSYLEKGVRVINNLRCRNSEVALSSEPLNKSDFLVSGTKKSTYCSIARSYDNLCGYEGKYWEAKPKEFYLSTIDQIIEYLKALFK